MGTQQPLYEKLLSVIPHDPAWLDRYFRHITESGLLACKGAERHHIVPRSVAPQYVNFRHHPWNRVFLSPTNHLLAHYYLFRAFPDDSRMVLAFAMMSKRSLADCLTLEDGPELQEALEAYGRSKQLIQEHASVVARQTVPRGEAHFNFGKSWSPEVRAKISEGLRDQVQGTLTRLKRAHALAHFGYRQIPASEHEVYREALNATEEEFLLFLRQDYPTNSRQYIVITGIRAIRMGVDVDYRILRQARWYLSEAGTPLDSLQPLTPRSADVRMGQGHTLHPDQKSAHELRKAGRPKGEMAARIAHNAMTPEDHALVRRAWDTQDLKKIRDIRMATENGSRVIPVRGRVDNILFGMELILNGEAYPDNFDRWRTAAAWVSFSELPVPLRPDALETLQRSVAPDAVASEVTIPEPETARFDAKVTHKAGREKRQLKESATRSATAARKSYDAIPEDEHASFRRAWESQSLEVMREEQKRWPHNTRPCKILTNLQTIFRGDATVDGFERWRQAALWLRFSGFDVPVEGEALDAVNKIVA